jgi:hypothetical protein
MGKPGRDKQAKNQGAWSKEEDQKLIDYIRKHGEGCWSYLPQAAGFSFYYIKLVFELFKFINYLVSLVLF